MFLLINYFEAEDAFGVYHVGVIMLSEYDAHFISRCPDDADYDIMEFKDPNKMMLFILKYGDKITMKKYE